MKNYDVIVIGAGNGGLTATACLAQAGKKVLLIEQHNLPGGFASSFIRGRFEFEPALHELCSLGNEKVGFGDLGVLFNKLGVKVKWHDVPEAFRLITTNDGDENIDVVLPFGVENFINTLEQYIPGSTVHTKKYFALLKEITDALAFISSCGDKYDKKKLIKEYPNFLKVASYTVSEVEHALGIPKNVCSILNAYWCYLGVEVDKLDFFLYACMCQQYLSKGAVAPSMRSHEISSALLAKIYEFGGEVWFNTKVTKIIVKDGKCCGVIAKDNEYTATEIICNASPHVAFGSLMDSKDVPEIEKRKCNVRHTGGQGYTVYMGLNKSPEELGLNDYSYFVYPTSDAAKTRENMLSDSGERMIACTCLNRVVPDCSPNGTTIFSITTLFFGDALLNIDEKNYVKEKNRIAADLLSYFEKSTGIILTPYIEEICIASPMTFARYTGAYNGSIYGYDTTPMDSVLTRELFYEKDKTIPNLWFVGGFAHRAHGYSSAYLSGSIIANKILNANKATKKEDK